MAYDSTTEAKTRKLLVVHDGELLEIGPLFESMGLPFTECRGPLSPEQRDADWNLVVATPRRILELRLSPENTRTRLIAILDQDSRTLRNSLKRAGIEKMVRRPVHPSALRAVVLHALYRGPEKRRCPRVSVGAQIKVRIGWRKHSAVLTDLSIGGCRLVSGTPIERGRSFSLHVPAQVSGDKAFSVKARTLESERSALGPNRDAVITARFENLSTGQLAQIRAAVIHHKIGPAQMPGRTPVAVAETSPPITEIPAVERREAERKMMLERVAALDDEAARILMGHDLSVGGMRVDPTPDLAVGMELRLAIHVPDRERPLVLEAKVHRDDGDLGVVLRFCQPTAEALRYLNELMDQLPMIEGGDESTEAVLVTELLATA